MTILQPIQSYFVIYLAYHMVIVDSHSHIMANGHSHLIIIDQGHSLMVSIISIQEKFITFLLTQRLIFKIACALLNNIKNITFHS